MSDACYLCRMGLIATLASGLAAGEAFGTCNDCFVHACPKHGERNRQYFRCADCVGAGAAMAALRADPAESDPDTARASSPRLAAGSAGLRSRFDGARMGAAISWLRNRLVAREPLIVYEHNGVPFERLDGAGLLALDREELDPEVTESEALLRAALIDEELRSAVSVDPDDLTDPHSDQMRAAGEVATVGLAIAYSARGVDEPDLSPLRMRGGLTLPPSLVAVGHAYAVANAVFLVASEDTPA
jgi:hypothetical protein